MHARIHTYIHTHTYTHTHLLCLTIRTNQLTFNFKWGLFCFVLFEGYKTQELTEEQKQRRQQRAKKRRQQAHEKREKDKVCQWFFFYHCIFLYFICSQCCWKFILQLVKPVHAYTHSYMCMHWHACMHIRIPACMYTYKYTHAQLPTKGLIFTVLFSLTETNNGASSEETGLQEQGSKGKGLHYCSGFCF